MTDSTDDRSHRCRTCGDPVANTDGQRVVSAIEEGTAVHRHFCDADCLDAWTGDSR